MTLYVYKLKGQNRKFLHAKTYLQVEWLGRVPLLNSTWTCMESPVQLQRHIMKQFVLNLQLPLCNYEPHLYKLHFRDNFLKLDVYYKRLSYDDVRQQPAFEFLSFLSEVGGFLGMGYSILNACFILIAEPNIFILGFISPPLTISQSIYYGPILYFRSCKYDNVKGD